MQNDHFKIIERKLNFMLSEMKQQTALQIYYPSDRLSFDEEINQINEYINLAGEYGLAYESIIANLEQVPFVLSGSAAVTLLELGLIFRFKTDREEDAMYDLR